MWSEEILEQFILLASQKLKGDWVICGASVLPLLGIDSRTTWDIDFYGLNNPSQKEFHNLMEIAEGLGIPAECINSSAGYYLTKIPKYKNHLVSLQEVGECRIYRPDLFLFTQMKLKRFSEVDMQDCFEMYKFTKQNLLDIPLKKLKIELTNALTNSIQPEKAKRIVQFMQILNT